jgi:2-amino-4-hydroxy-6-hydroxymethyldihydropteridine diphosphokinase
MTQPQIFIGLGANLPSPRYGSPRETLAAALAQLAAAGVAVAERSAWYESAPVPASDQPWYVNGVARVETALAPAALLAILNRIEAAFGRVRGERNAPRIVDLDIIAYGDLVVADGPPPLLPHPRMADRGFVLLPLRDIAPGWRHPISGASLDDLIARLPADQVTRRLT